MNLYKNIGMIAVGLLATAGVAVGQTSNTNSPLMINGDEQGLVEFTIEHIIANDHTFNVAPGTVLAGGNAAPADFETFDPTSRDYTVYTGTDRGNLAKIYVTATYSNWDVLLTTVNGGELHKPGAEKTSFVPGHYDNNGQWVDDKPATYENSIPLKLTDGNAVKVKIGLGVYRPVASEETFTAAAWWKGELGSESMSGDGLSFAKLLDANAFNTNVSSITGRNDNELTSHGFGSTASWNNAGEVVFFVDAGLAVQNANQIGGNASGVYTEDITFTFVANY